MTLEIDGQVVELEAAPCPLGCEPNDEVVLCGRDRIHGLPGRFAIVCCRQCQLLRTSPRPTANSAGLYYPPSYAPFRSTQVTTRRQTRLGLGARLVDKLRIHHDCLPPMPTGGLLELGCASGAFLQRMASEGWRVAGIESSPPAAAAARELGCEVFTGRAEQAPAPREPYDLIVAWMVIEHLHDPVGVLRRLSEWLRPDGWFVFSVPNAAGPWWSIFGDCWYELSLPQHLFHFTPTTVRQLLEYSGWRMRRIWHQRLAVSPVASLGCALEERRIAGRVARWLVGIAENPRFSPVVLYPAGWMLAALGMSGRMTVWAQRDT